MLRFFFSFVFSFSSFLPFPPPPPPPPFARRSQPHGRSARHVGQPRAPRRGAGMGGWHSGVGGRGRLFGRALSPSVPTFNKYLYCAVQKTSASQPRGGGAGALPVPVVTWGTPCRATAPAGSPARSPVSGCSAVR